MGISSADDGGENGRTLVLGAERGKQWIRRWAALKENNTRNLECCSVNAIAVGEKV